MVAIKPPKQIKLASNLKIAIRYILNPEKTTIRKTSTLSQPFPLVIQNGEEFLQLVSGHLVSELSVADEEMLMTKRVAALEKGDDDFKEITSEKNVLAHHIIQSFSPEDQLTPEKIHEIGRKTILDFTGGEHEFVIATHVDKHHVHNHIILNTTNSVSLRKMRWQKKTLKNLRAISDKHADLYGAKIIQATMKNSHKKYSAWRRQNNFRFELKKRLDFLLQHSVSLADFKEKAQVLNIQIDFSGKYIKYRLLDSEQEKNIRDRTLSKNGQYALEGIKERVAKNQATYSLAEIQKAYQEEQKIEETDFDLKVTVESWQVEEETKNGIYLQMDFGALNSGTILIPAHKVDKREDGNYDLFIRKNDYFYFLNENHSKDNRYMMGKTVVKQLTDQNGGLALTKHPYISSMKQLVKEFNFLTEHQVKDGIQFESLEKRFNEKIREVDRELKKLDQRLAHFHKVEGVLLSEKIEPNSPIPALFLEKLNLKSGTQLEDIQKIIEEVKIERGALHQFFGQTLEDYTNYKEVKKSTYSRQELEREKKEESKTRH